jgi:hypothetical protein
LAVLGGQTREVRAAEARACRQATPTATEYARLVLIFYAIR